MGARAHRPERVFWRISSRQSAATAAPWTSCWRFFRRHGEHVHVEALHNGEFDWLVYFEDGKPDAYCYCIADEGCHLTYHRFTKEDYEAFGFETT